MASLFGSIGEFVDITSNGWNTISQEPNRQCEQEVGRCLDGDRCSILQTAQEFGVTHQTGRQDISGAGRGHDPAPQPSPSEIVQQYRFHSRFRKTGETVATYVSKLRAVAQNCNYKDTLDDMLRDRLVCRINHESDPAASIGRAQAYSHKSVGTSARYGNGCLKHARDPS